MASKKDKNNKSTKTAHVLNLITTPAQRQAAAQKQEETEPAPGAAASAVPVASGRPLTPPVIEVAHSQDEKIADQIRSALTDELAQLAEEPEAFAAPAAASVVPAGGTTSEDRAPAAETASAAAAAGGEAAPEDCVPAAETASAAAAAGGEAAPEDRAPAAETAPAVAAAGGEAAPEDRAPAAETAPAAAAAGGEAAPEDRAPAAETAPAAEIAGAVPVKTEDAPPVWIEPVHTGSVAAAGSSESARFSFHGPAPAPHSGSDLMYVNIMQTMVEAMAPRYIKMFGVCKCSRCAADVKALTLTNLAPKYAVFHRRDRIPMLTVYENRYGSLIAAQLTKACSIVKINPHHR